MAVKRSETPAPHLPGTRDRRDAANPSMEMSGLSRSLTDSIPQVLTVEQAGRMLGIGRDLAYQLARTGNMGGVPVLRLGRRLVVSRRALERVLAGELLLPVDGETANVS